MLKKILFISIISFWAPVAFAQESPNISKVVGLDLEFRPHEDDFKLDFDIGGSRLFVSGKLSKSRPNTRVIHVYDTETQELINVIRHSDGETFIGFGNTQGFGDAISANERFMVTANTSVKGIRQVLVYDTASLELLRTIDNPNPDAKTYIDFSDFVLPENALAGIHVTVTFQNAQKQNGVFIFDVETGQQIATAVAPGITEGLFNKLFNIKERTVFTMLDFDGTRVLAKDIDAFGSSKSRERSDKVYVFDVKNNNLLQTFNITDIAAEIAPESGFISEKTAFVLGRGSKSFNQFYNIYAFDLKTGDLKFTLEDPFASLGIEGIQKGKFGTFGSNTALMWPYLIVYMPDLLINNSPSEAFFIYDADTGQRLGIVDFPRRSRDRLQFLQIYDDDGLLIVTEIGDPTRKNRIDIYAVE
ncbi:YncE family protein [Parasulfitobacter algicola]|uniref:Uncharacterized protein n=1 Tax=Parasulfitobacter algicola TaxID=2614809 RepID=A0ABX2IS65_9RHOB|nr:hypothetical protein [Sulfitobacter algicola]NSX55742.1 hypothetical protein [Sulfitobacter algicola]